MVHIHTNIFSNNFRHYFFIVCAWKRRSKKSYRIINNHFTYGTTTYWTSTQFPLCSASFFRGYRWFDPVPDWEREFSQIIISQQAAIVGVRWSLCECLSNTPRNSFSAVYSKEDVLLIFHFWGYFPQDSRLSKSRNFWDTEYRVYRGLLVYFRV